MEQVEKFNHIIDEAYLNYSKNHFKIWEPGMDYESKESFIRKCKTNPEFSGKWGLKIEEREMSTNERKKLCDVDPETECRNNAEIELYLELQNIPTKLITLTYQNKTIESYE